MNQVSGYFLVLNAKQFPGDSGPKSYKDLADPQYKGKILLDKARPGGLRHGLGRDRVVRTRVRRGLREGPCWSNTKAVSDEPPPTSSTHRQRQLRHPGARHFQRRLGAGRHRNSPVRLVVPSDGMMVSIGAVCFMKAAPHPNAAKVYLNFLDGQSAQKFYGDAPGGSFIRAEIIGVQAWSLRRSPRRAPSSFPVFSAAVHRICRGEPALLHQRRESWCLVGPDTV